MLLKTDFLYFMFIQIKVSQLEHLQFFNMQQNNNNVAPVPVQEGPEDFQVEIQNTDTGLYFYIRVAPTVPGTKIPKTKAVLKKLDGVRNARIGMYKFSTARFSEVMAALGQNSTNGIADPRKTIKVQFTGIFQWPGDMVVAEGVLGQIGLKQAKNGIWQGDLGKYTEFQKAFSAPAPAAVNI
jgi:hypothetical protein